MAANRFYFLTLSVIVAVLGYLSFLVLKPFLSPIAWAVVLSLVFYPLYANIHKYIKWESLSSLITLSIILIIILGPFSYLTVLLVNELRSISTYLEGDRTDLLQGALHHPTARALIHWITTIFNITEPDLDKTIMDSVAGLGKELVGRITRNLGDVVTVALNFIFMAFAIFFVLKDGTKFLIKIRDYMPFSEEQKDRLTTQIRDIIISTVYGGVAVAIIQGLIAGIAFSFLGVPSPVVWGLATAIASFIPILGAFAIWGPAAVYLFIQGQIFNSIALAVVGVFGISMIDNILKPIIIGERTKMPILVIFFSVLGGIELFGLIGLVMGPLVLAIFVSVVEIFRSIEGGHNA